MSVPCAVESVILIDDDMSINKNSTMNSIIDSGISSSRELVSDSAVGSESRHEPAGLRAVASDMSVVGLDELLPGAAIFVG